MIGEENFPLVTFILSAAMVAVFLFTANNILYYENLLGFIPLSPKAYSLITYSFIHVDIIHLFFNLVFLLVAGLAVEQALGRFVFFSVYLSSANIAVIFDIVGRFISKVSFTSPFVGASGAIFGVLAIAALIRPDEKIPTFLNLLVFAAILLSFSPYLQLFYNYQRILEPQVFMLVSTVLIMLAASVIAFLPSFPPLYIVTLIFIINWAIVVFFNLSPGISNVGHLGGVMGGMVSFFLFAKVIKIK
jgi:membrane associated rhomboid family serine protease